MVSAGSHAAIASAPRRGQGRFLDRATEIAHPPAVRRFRPEYQRSAIAVVDADAWHRGNRPAAPNPGRRELPTPSGDPRCLMAEIELATRGTVAQTDRAYFLTVAAAALRPGGASRAQSHAAPPWSRLPRAQADYLSRLSVSSLTPPPAEGAGFRIVSLSPLTANLRAGCSTPVQLGNELPSGSTVKVPSASFTL